MRCDTPVFFQRVQSGKYNPGTGNYGKDTVSEEKRYASVTDAGAETLKLIYGEIRQGVLVIRLQTHYTESFDRIRVGNRVYTVDFSRKLRTKHVFVTSEVQ